MLFIIILSIMLVAFIIAAIVIGLERDSSKENVQEPRMDHITKHKSLYKTVVWSDDGEARPSDYIPTKRISGQWSFEPYEGDVAYRNNFVEGAQESSQFGWANVDTEQKMIVTAKDHDNRGCFHVIDKETLEIEQTIVGNQVGAQFGYSIIWKANLLYVSAPMYELDGEHGKGVVFVFVYAGQTWKEHSMITCHVDDCNTFGVSLSKNGQVAWYDSDNALHHSLLEDCLQAKISSA